MHMQNKIIRIFLLLLLWSPNLVGRDWQLIKDLRNDELCRFIRKTIAAAALVPMIIVLLGFTFFSFMTHHFVSRHIYERPPSFLVSLLLGILTVIFAVLYVVFTVHANRIAREELELLHAKKSKEMS